MNANKREKARVVKEIKTKLQNASALVVIDYQGMTVKQFQALRKELKTKNIELQVYKNRLFKIAADSAGFKDLNTSLTGQNAYAFGSEDDIAPAKIIAKFAEEFPNNVLEFKSGIFEKKVVDAAELAKIATLPSYEEALGILARQMISPLKYIAVGLNQLVEEGKIAA